MGIISYNNPSPVKFDISWLVRTRPHLVPRDVNVVFDYLTVKIVGATVGQHRLEQIGTLLIRHRRRVAWRRAFVCYQKNHHPTVTTIRYVALRGFAENVLSLPSCHYHSLITYEAICSSQLISELCGCGGEFKRVNQERLYRLLRFG